MTNTALTETFIHVSGSCNNSCGFSSGGWAAILRGLSDGNVAIKRELSGSEMETTNNRMELTAAIHGLRLIQKTKHLPIQVFSSSQYLVKGMTEHLKSWRSKNWKAANNKPIKNQDLWQQLAELSDGLVVFWQWSPAQASDLWGVEVKSRAIEAAKKAESCSLPHKMATAR